VLSATAVTPAQPTRPRVIALSETSLPANKRSSQEGEHALPQAGTGTLLLHTVLQELLTCDSELRFQIQVAGHPAVCSCI
jgi:hypothetical protein